MYEENTLIIVLLSISQLTKLLDVLIILMALEQRIIKTNDIQNRLIGDPIKVPQNVMFFNFFCCLSKKLGVLGSSFFHMNSQKVTIVQKGKCKVLETISIRLTDG
uniref:Uncharacterized protein n=1 Tax=Glossina austeni TaxID=7395 RepID=A0A1A9V7E7_GLOAU